MKSLSMQSMDSLTSKVSKEELAKTSEVQGSQKLQDPQDTAS